MLGKLQCVVLDCPDVLELARFYQSLLGGEVNKDDPRWSLDDDWATLHTGSQVLAFQRAKDYRPPQWPDPAYPQQFHLDIEVPDLDEACQAVLAQGGTLLQPGKGGWLVMADPAGHPFCLLKG
jgi:catechol 2,3-dioxygenase-like lactoylglutathione lyase family enzyme